MLLQSRSLLLSLAMLSWRLQFAVGAMREFAEGQVVLSRERAFRLDGRCGGRAPTCLRAGFLSRSREPAAELAAPAQPRRQEMEVANGGLVGRSSPSCREFVALGRLAV